MEAMSTKGPLVRDSDMEAMNSILTPGANQSRLGHIVHDIQWLAQGLRWVFFSCVNPGANSMAHSLSRNAKNAIEDIFWKEDTPPPSINALYFDSLQLNE